MDIQVAKSNHGQPGYYIGRGTPLSNPFYHPKDGTRDEVAQKYKDWLIYQITLNNKEICGELNKLAEIAMSNQTLLLLESEQGNGEVVKQVLEMGIKGAKK